MPSDESSPTTVTPLTDERTTAAGPAFAPDWSAPNGELVLLDRRSRHQTPDDIAPPVRVMLAEGGRLVRAACRVVLEREADMVVVAEATSGREAVERAREVHPDVVVMNIGLPGVDGLAATRLITSHATLSKVRVLILAEEEHGEQLFAALRAGASGFLTMEMEPGELVRAVRVLAGGGGQLSPQDTRRLIDHVAWQPELPTAERFEELSARERQVVTLVALGLSNHEIAERLVVSPATAKTHVTRSMLKLQVHDRARLVALAYQTGFTRSGDRIGRWTGC